MPVRSSPPPALTAVVKWRGLDCRFEDGFDASLTAIEDPRLPQPLRAALENLHPGESLELDSLDFLLPPWSRENRHWIARDAFRPGADARCAGGPAFGRFHPRECFLPARPEWPQALSCCRILALEDSRMHIDCNHPLAGRKARLLLKVRECAQGEDPAPGGLPELLDWLRQPGPGMQDRLATGETDFCRGNPFEREDEDDEAFFSEPSLTPFWDRVALAEVSRLYQRLLDPGMRILDLMAGVHSPLQEAAIDPVAVHCAGLNPVELEHNPICRERRVLNVNAGKALPWPDQHFDAVLIHAAIEYVRDPVFLLHQVHRLLRPGGRLIISFSDHFLPGKAIRIWREACLYERPGILLSWLRRQGGFGQFRGYSRQGRARPHDDARYPRRPLADPVFAVCARRSDKKKEGRPKAA